MINKKKEKRKVQRKAQSISSHEKKKLSDFNRLFFSTLINEGNAFFEGGKRREGKK
jgi:hypothetical protein